MQATTQQSSHLWHPMWQAMIGHVSGGKNVALESTRRLGCVQTNHSPIVQSQQLKPALALCQSNYFRPLLYHSVNRPFVHPLVYLLNPIDVLTRRFMHSCIPAVLPSFIPALCRFLGFFSHVFIMTVKKKTKNSTFLNSRCILIGAIFTVTTWEKSGTMLV